SAGPPAPGTRKIHITAAVPTPHADPDTAAASGAVVADGNVITGVGGVDANPTDGVADTKGADGASVTGVAAGVQASANGSVGASVAGAHGSITIAADGSYSYTANAADPALIALGVGATATDTFTYTITDGDGDKSTTTITITINGVNEAPTATPDTNWTKEDTNLQATGDVLINQNHPGAPSGSFADHADTDPDAGDVLSVSQVNGNA